MPTEAQLTLGIPSSTYSPSEDVKTVVSRVIAEYPEKFRHLSGLPIACLLRSSKRSEDGFSVDGSGGGFVRADRERGIGGPYLGVWFRDRHWSRLDDEGRRAWVFHQLAHFVARPKGEGVTRVGHDVEAFTDEAAIFGAWESQLVLFANNLTGSAPADASPARAPLSVVTDEPLDGPPPKRARRAPAPTTPPSVLN